MNKEEKKEELLFEVTSLYDEYLQETEKRGVSYGEVAYLQSLNVESLEEIKKQIEILKEREIPLF